MSDLGEVSGAIRSVSDMVTGILSRHDRDEPQKELDENLVKIQNAFAENMVDSDEFRAFVDRLFNSTGHSLTPTGDIPMGRREFTHAALVAIAELKYAKAIIARLIANNTKDK